MFACCLFDVVCYLLLGVVGCSLFVVCGLFFVVVVLWCSLLLVGCCFAFVVCRFVVLLYVVCCSLSVVWFLFRWLLLLVRCWSLLFVVR